MKSDQWYRFCLRITGLICGLLLTYSTSVADDGEGSFTGPGDVGTATDTVGGGARREARLRRDRGISIPNRKSIEFRNFRSSNDYVPQTRKSKKVKNSYHKPQNRPSKNKKGGNLKRNVRKRRSPR